MMAVPADDDCSSGRCTCKFEDYEIFRASDNRMDIVAFREIMEEATASHIEHEKLFEAIVENSAGLDRVRMCLAWTKEKANLVFESGRYEDSIRLYKEAMRCVMGEDKYFVLAQFENDGYKKALLSKLHYTVSLDLIFCCNRISEAYLRLGDRASVS